MGEKKAMTVAGVPVALLPAASGLLKAIGEAARKPVTMDPADPEVEARANTWRLGTASGERASQSAGSP